MRVVVVLLSFLFVAPLVNCANDYHANGRR